MNQNAKSLLFILLILSLFPISYFWRQYRDRDISQHSKYSIAYIFKKTGSLKSGEQWHFEFKYGGKRYEGYRSTHKDYDVNIGDFFLVNFSTKYPEHSKILYEFKLDTAKLKYWDVAWDTIPKNLFVPQTK